MHPKEQSVNAGQEWSRSSLFWFGTFGCRTPAARRYYKHCYIALGVFVLFGLVEAALRNVIPKVDWAWAVVPGGAFGYIAWQLRKYLLALDELERRIQLESIAWTYLTGMALSMFLAGFGFLNGWNINPVWFIVLEPIRGAYLYFGAQRF